MPTQQYIRYPLNFGVTTINGFSGAVTLLAGSNITITPGVNTLTIASTGGSGVITIGTFDSQAPAANALVISGTTLYAQSASATAPGMVNNTAQSFSGVKTFTSAPNLSSLTASTALVLDASKNIASLAYSSNDGVSNLIARSVDGNFITNNAVSKALATVSAGSTTVLTVASAPYQILTGSLAQTYQLPDATTLSAGGFGGGQIGWTFYFNNNSTGTLTVSNNAGTPLFTVPAGGAANIVLTVASTSNGVWDVHYLMPSNAQYGTSGLAITGTISASNFSGSSSGTNTGDVTLAAVGSSPNANGATLVGQVLNLEPASSSQPGILTTGSQNIQGSKSFLSKTAFAAPLILSATQDSTLSGSNADIAAVPTYVTYYDNAALVSIASIVSVGVTQGQEIKILNLTGAPITLVNNYGSAPGTSAAIIMPSGTNVVIPNNGSAIFRFGPTGVWRYVVGDAVVQLSNSSMVSGTVPIANGGTGQVTANAAFNALSPMTTGGDVIYGGASGVATRLANGSAGQVLTSQGTTLAPIWAAASAGSVTSVAMSVPSFLSVSGSPITSSGTLAVTLSGTALPIANGGTGQVTASAAFDALSPMTTGGDIIYGGASGTGTRLANGTAGQFLKSQGTTLAPIWSSVTAATTPPTIQKFLSTGTTTGYVFIITAANATVGATYTNNGNTYTVLSTIAAGNYLFTSQASAPQASGTLTKASGTGDATITFSSATALATYTTPASVSYLEIMSVGGGGGGSGASSGAGNGGTGTNTYFGSNVIISGGGGGGNYASASNASVGTNTISSGTTVLNVFGGGATASTNVVTTSGACGGVSYYGGAGGGGYAATNGQAAQANSGSGGGGGGAQVNSNSGAGGASGGFTQVIITSPGATYVYAVGTGGAGGTGTATGGAGGSGQIVVKEYY